MWANRDSRAHCRSDPLGISDPRRVLDSGARSDPLGPHGPITATSAAHRCHVGHGILGAERFAVPNRPAASLENPSEIAPLAICRSPAPNGT